MDPDDLAKFIIAGVGIILAIALIKVLLPWVNYWMGG